MSEFSLGTGRFLSGQTDLLARPRGTPLCRYMVLLFHGATGHARDWYSRTGPGALALTRALADCGAVAVATEWGGDQWGNDTCVGYIETVRLAAATYGCDPAKVVLCGGSMGGQEVWRYIYEHGDKVTGAAMIAPVTDLASFYAANTLGLQSSIAGAWGVTAPAALPAKADPLSNAATIAAKNVPMTVYYSSADTAIPEASLVAMDAAVPAIDLVKCSTTAAHGDGITVAALPLGLAATLLGAAA